MMITDYKSFEEMPMFISIPQAAVVLGISNPCLYGIIKRDPNFPILNLGRRKVIPTKALEKWIEENCKR